MPEIVSNQIKEVGRNVTRGELRKLGKIQPVRLRIHSCDSFSLALSVPVGWLVVALELRFLITNLCYCLC